MTETQKKFGYGNFGNLAEEYELARQKYTSEVIDLLWALFKHQRKCFVLDLGCGTGISTRQIFKKLQEENLANHNILVVGCDKDPLMLEKATAHPENRGESRLTYGVDNAEALSFLDASFDAITAFGSFHWFTSQKAISEIKRVLTPEGFFFVVNKNDTDGFKNGFRKIIKDAVGEELPEIKKDYNAARILDESGFRDIQTQHFICSELFTPEQALLYLQSVSIWNLVPTEKKEKTLNLLKEYCWDSSENGQVRRTIEVKAVFGWNSWE